MATYKILIVEDEMISALAMQETLERSGFVIIGLATTGDEALENLAADLPDLVLMDINLDEKEDGIVIGKRILHEYKLPVVFITAYTDRDTISRAREFFPYGFIVKPWQEGELLAVLETAIFKHLADKQSREFLETRNKFFSVIGHDLRSPLAALALTTRTLKKHLHVLSKQELQEFIQDIHATVENLYAFTDNMLEWAKIQNGYMEVLPEVLSLKVIVAEVTALLQGKANSKGITISTDVAPVISVLADRNMLRSILLNLLSNGLKFSYPAATISIKAYTEGAKAVVQVIDQGVGMGKTQIQSLMKFNHAVHTSGTQEEKGTGLGLMLCKEFAEANGGSLTIQSQQEIGTTVNFTIPLASR